MVDRIRNFKGNVFKNMVNLPKVLYRDLMVMSLLLLLLDFVFDILFISVQLKSLAAVPGQAYFAPVVGLLKQMVLFFFNLLIPITLTKRFFDKQ